MHIQKTNIPAAIQIPGAIARQALNFGDATGYGKIAGEYFSLGAGTDIAPLLKGLEDDLCQSLHWGYLLEGEVTVTYKDGQQETISAGDLFYWPPGHTVKVGKNAEKYIYFNSDRTGTMQIWRMLADGTQQEQVTKDEFNNWFAHPSPDGKWLVFLSYEKEVTGHPANKDVTLRLMPLGGGEIQVLAKLFGGQGTINVPSWSPDSRRLAFVSYQFVP